MTPTTLAATNTTTPSPTPRPTFTPRPSPTPSPTSTLTPTRTYAPTPTRDPSLPSFPTPELGELERFLNGGFSFRHLVGYEIREHDNTVIMVNEENDIVVSLSGFSTRTYGSLEHVITGLLSNLSDSLTNFSTEPVFPTSVNGHQSLGSIIHGELSGQKVSGLVQVVAPTKTQLFYAVTFIPDSPEGSLWQSDGWPVVDAVLSSIEFFPPAGD